MSMEHLDKPAAVHVPELHCNVRRVEMPLRQPPTADPIRSS
jgi:hypothetical protein